jgi:short-subunit dehydrogenase
LALYYPTMAVVPRLRAQRSGRIVNVTSVAGKLPIPHNASYVVGKYAATGFSAVCAAELRKYGIRVSTVMPPPLRNGAWMNAGYKGHVEEELAWFVRALSSPLVSIDPERAARAIVEAARYGDAETMVAPSSWLQSRAYALFPELTCAALAALEQYGMPATPLGARAAPVMPGAEILATTDNPRVHRAARQGKAAGVRYLQPVAAKLDNDGKLAR